MSSSKVPFNEHRDLYLEILKKAEKEADRALMKIIADRLKENRPEPCLTKDGCQVFAFPETGLPPNAPDQDHLFWKSGQFWQDLVQFMALLSAGVSWFILFCNLITYHPVG